MDHVQQKVDASQVFWCGAQCRWEKVVCSQKRGDKKGRCWCSTAQSAWGGESLKICGTNHQEMLGHSFAFFLQTSSAKLLKIDLWIFAFLRRGISQDMCKEVMVVKNNEYWPIHTQLSCSWHWQSAVPTNYLILQLSIRVNIWHNVKFKVDIWTTCLIQSWTIFPNRSPLSFWFLVSVFTL